MARDVDLCRDEDVLPDLSAGEAKEATKSWPCSSCANEFDRLSVEEELVARVQRLVLGWQTQGLLCGKCRRVTGEGFSEHCGCGGQWVGILEAKGNKDGGSGDTEVRKGHREV